MSKPVKQHDLPATYLRRFAIDPDCISHKRMIWCYRNVHNKHFIEEKSVHASLFKTVDFYTINHDEEPYAIEKFFSAEVEPRYEQIMNELSQEKNLSIECRQNIILWLHFNKIRNKSKRAQLKNMMDKKIMLDFIPKFGLKKFNEARPEILSFMEEKAKEMQINALINTQLQYALDKGLGAKHWLILKSKPECPFVTNDNPGFSIVIEEDRADFTSLSSTFAVHHAATNYFILSPKYCLVISPFYQGTPLDLSIWNQKIEFLRSGQTHIDFINYCTIQTSGKYVISNSKSSLERVRDFRIKVSSDMDKS